MGQSNKWSLSVVLGLLPLLVFSCEERGEEPAISRKLPEMMRFTGLAEGKAEGFDIQCRCDMILEVPDFVTGDNSSQQYIGTLGGEITRVITDDEGAGFSFSPFLFGDAEAMVTANDSVFLAWPANEGTGTRFYDEIALFEGRLNTDGSVTGSWKCAPLDISEGGYVDLKGTVEGSWNLEKIEE
jgi:hypothetical protein